MTLAEDLAEKCFINKSPIVREDAIEAINMAIERCAQEADKGATVHIGCIANTELGQAVPGAVACHIAIRSPHSGARRQE